MKKTLSIFAIFVFGYIILTGQIIDNDSPRWNVNPAMTRLTPVGKYQNLPTYPNTDNYVNPNTKTSYYYSPNGVMAVSPNFMLKPSVISASTQSEVNITSSLTNPNLILASCNYFDGSSTFSTPGYVSTNGGTNFAGNDISVSNFGDPAPMIDKNNNMIISYITLAGSMGTSRSVSPYTSWSATYTFPGASTSADKNLSGTNYASASPYYGHSYTVYTEFGGTYVNRIVFTKTTDGGVSWSSIAPLSPTPSSGHHHQGCDVTAGPEGNVYAIWANCTTNGQNSTEDSLGFAKSTDGGTTWAIQTNHAADMNGIRAASFGPWGIRVAGFPRIDVDRSGGARNGWIYVVAPQKTGLANADASDIFMWYSSNQGTSWSAPIRVNQDAVGSGKLQYHAAINVDNGGGVNVVYEDCRNSTNNDSVQTYLSRSVDGGTTWTDVLISDHKFRPAPISGTATGYQGDYIGITSGNNKIIPNWAENRSGKYQSWAAIVDIGPSIAHTPLLNTEQTSGTRNVDCIITPAGSPINPSTVKLYYSKDNPTLTTNITMTNSSGNNWTAALPLSGAGLYRYYITATDNLSRTATYPAGAPANNIQFTASPDLTPPVIAHTPIGATPKIAWPVTVTATVTDNIGLDSSWVKWYKNNTGTGIKQFKLINTSGSTFSAAFNSVNSDVSVGDVIYYKIFAQDNSSNHNRDSSALINFSITTLRLCENFSGGVVPPTNWTVSGTYWTYNTVSGYASGTGSAKFDFWTATSGTNEMLTTLTFDPTIAGDSLKFDLAHALYNTSIDSLIVETSINGGTSYTTLAPMYAGSTFTAPLCMSTVASTSNYTPTSAADWKSRAFVLPVGTNKVRFRAKSAFGNNLYIDNTCLSNPITGVTPITLEIPSVYSLSQNYPNPFNPVTKINFALPKQGFVTLKIYDVLGREVKTLVNEVKAAGHFSVDFNASEFSSGVYFYRMESNGFNDIKKMMLIK